MQLKSYTDLEQSRKLAEFLPHETADMYYDGFGRLPQGYAYTLISPNSFEYDKPCWSLTALLSVLPDYTLQTNINGTVFVVCDSKKPIPMISEDYDNPIDACVAMILKLHELNLL